MQPRLILHFAGAGTIYRGIARPGTAAKAFPDVVVGRTKEASQTGYGAEPHSGRRKHPEGKDSILDLLAIII